MTGKYDKYGYQQEWLNESQFWAAMIFRPLDSAAERININKDVLQASVA